VNYSHYAGDVVPTCRRLKHPKVTQYCVCRIHDLLTSLVDAKMLRTDIVFRNPFFLQPPSSNCPAYLPTPCLYHPCLSAQQPQILIQIIARDWRIHTTSMPASAEMD
jgi:hypothetical protein